MRRATAAQIVPALAVMALCGALPGPQTGAPPQVIPHRLPVAFEEHRGPLPGDLRFLSRGPGRALAIRRTGAAFAIAGKDQSAVVRMECVGAHQGARMAGAERLPGKVNHYLGPDPSRWRTGISTYGSVRCKSVYPGIDLVYHGNQGELEYDFVVSPGADPSQVLLRFSGASVAVDAAGDLAISTPAGSIRNRRPVVYQETSGRRETVSGRYRLRDAPGGTLVAFDLGSYDRSRRLVIDPVIQWSTLVGGSAEDQAVGVGRDSGGNLIVGGWTVSANFPVASAVQPVGGGLHDAVVLKLDPTGSTLLYSTSLGGNTRDVANGLTVSLDGVYVCGETDGGFPVTPGAFQTAHGGNTDAWAAKLDPTGALVYSTYLGGTSLDAALSGAVDPVGSFYVAGHTLSDGYPTVPGSYQVVKSGVRDAFVTKLNPSGSGLDYSTFLGGTFQDSAYGIRVSDNMACVFGVTGSLNFPVTTGALQTVKGLGDDCFVTRLNQSGSALLSSTYLGGNGAEFVTRGIDVDPGGNVYVAGFTDSTDFPVTAGAVQSVRSAGHDTFLTVIPPAGTTLLYSTYLGGSGTDQALGVSVPKAGEAWITGSTTSLNFPLANAIQGAYGSGVADAFVSRIDISPDASGTLVFSTYLGGGGDDKGFAVFADKLGNCVVGGRTAAGTFPITPGAFDTTFNGGLSDFFITQIGLGPRAPGSLMATAVSSTRIDLSWTDNSSDETNFAVVRKTGAGPFEGIVGLPANTIAYQVTDLSPATTYTFRVSASNALGSSAWSNEASATTLPAAPAAPARLFATAGQAPMGGAEIVLVWDDNSDNETGFAVERRTDGGFTQIATTGAFSVGPGAYADMGLSLGTTYTYRVRAFNNGGFSAYTNEAAATPPTLPAAPSNLTATLISATRVELLWTDNSSNETGFTVERKDPGGVFMNIGGRGANLTTWTDTRQPDTTYSYRVRADNVSGSSPYSNELTVTTLPNPPAAPTALGATAVSVGTIDLVWLDNSNNETGFKIERKPPSGAFTQVAVTGAGAVAYSDTGLTAETTYTYRVRAFNAGGDSDYSNEAAATTIPIPPTAPSDLTARALSSGLVSLSWRDNSDNEDFFYVERKIGSGAFGFRASVEANVRSFEDSYLVTARTTYTYRVRCLVSGEGFSDYSNEATVTTPAPGKLQVSPGSLRFRATPPGAVSRSLKLTLRNRVRTASLGVRVFDPGIPFRIIHGTGSHIIPGGGSVVVEVAFVSDFLGSFTGEIRITSDDPSKPDVRVPLTGVCR